MTWNFGFWILDFRLLACLSNSINSRFSPAFPNLKSKIVNRKSIDLASAARRTVSIAAAIVGASSTGQTFRLSLPRRMRETSNKSSMVSSA